jgi:sugar lactone lactonase YvrE
MTPEFRGQGLARPESVLVARDGSVFCAHTGADAAGVAALAPDGTHRVIAGSSADLPGGLKPNGIAFAPDGSFLVAHLGAEDGGVFRLTPEGQLSPVLRAVEGVALPPTNYAMQDVHGRIWISVSTRLHPRSADWVNDAATGFLALLDARGARVVAEGLGYTNECVPSPDGRFLYVNETYGRRLSRFPLAANGALGAKQVVAEFPPGVLPDGLAFDTEGQVWVAAIVANQILRIDPRTGRVEAMLDAGEPAHTEAVAQAIAERRLTPAMMAAAPRMLGNVSSIAFAGPDQRGAYLGSLLSDRLAYVATHIAGAPPPHWVW